MPLTRFYKTIYYEMNISIQRILSNNYSHPDKITEVTGLLLLSTVALLPLVLLSTALYVIS